MNGLTFEELLHELHGLIGRSIGVAVYGGETESRVMLACFAGRLLGGKDFAEVSGIDFGEDDRLVFRVTGGDPNVSSLFFLGSDSFESARWQDTPHGDRELLIEVEGGALGLTLGE